MAEKLIVTPTCPFCYRPAIVKVHKRTPVLAQLVLRCPRMVTVLTCIHHIRRARWRHGV